MQLTRFARATLTVACDVRGWTLVRGFIHYQCATNYIKAKRGSLVCEAGGCLVARSSSDFLPNCTHRGL